MLGFVAGIVPFLLIISVIVTFHELGHFSVARLFNTRVERFSVGFGKILLSYRDKRGVEWCLSALPLGGYVKFAGDENIASMMPGIDELEEARKAITEREGAEAVKDYFHFKPLWQRFLIILAGPAANFVLAIVTFSLLFMVIGDQVGHPTIMEVVPGSPAARAGFHAGDVIKRIDGHDVENGRDVQSLIGLRANTTFQVQVERDHRLVTLSATPKRSPLDTGDKTQVIMGGVLGFKISDKIESRPLNPLQAVGKGFKETWKTLDTTLTYISRIFTGKENGDQVSGILGMTKAAGDLTVGVAQAQVPLKIKVINLGLNYMLYIAAISIGVGFLNLLPIPALDGGHLAFYVYQSVTKKPVSAGIQSMAFRIAAVLILGLMLFAAWNDINRIGFTRLIGGLFS